MVEAALATARRTHSGWRAQCPFCYAKGHNDRKTSLQILGDGRWWCYRSDEHPEAKKGKLPNPPDPSFVARAVIAHAKSQGKITTFQPPDYFVELADDDSESLRPAREYLLGRGHDRDVWKKLHIGACYAGKWSGRIIVPIAPRDFSVWYGWVGRLWCTPKKSAQGLAALKYLYPPGMEKDRFLYNESVLLRITEVPAMLVEGAFDCFPFPDDACAALGEMSEWQKIHVHKLLTTAAFPATAAIPNAGQNRPIAIVLDGDAWQKGHALAMSFRLRGLKAGCVRLPPRKDPDEIDQETLIDACHECIDSDDPVKI